MFYGYVSPHRQGVYTDFTIVKSLMKLYPYSKCRKFLHEDEAWVFVKRNSSTKPLDSLYNYGDIFMSHHIKVNYIIGKSEVFYNITPTDKNIRVFSDNPNVVIDHFGKGMCIRLNNIYLNRELLSAHSIAIYHLMDLVGEFIDIQLTVADSSIYYMLTAYEGSNLSFNKVRRKIANRLGGLALNVEIW